MPTLIDGAADVVSAAELDGAALVALGVAPELQAVSIMAAAPAAMMVLITFCKGLSF